MEKLVRIFITTIISIIHIHEEKHNKKKSKPTQKRRERRNFLVTRMNEGITLFTSQFFMCFSFNVSRCSRGKWNEDNNKKIFIFIFKDALYKKLFLLFSLFLHVPLRCSFTFPPFYFSTYFVF